MTGHFHPDRRGGLPHDRLLPGRLHRLVLAGLRYGLVCETLDSFLAKHRPAVVRVVSLMPSPSSACWTSAPLPSSPRKSRRLPRCVSRERPARRRASVSGGPEHSPGHVALRAPRRPAWFSLLNTLPGTHPNCTSHLSEQRPPNALRRSPFFLERVHRPGTSFTLAVLLLSRAPELHTRPTIVASLLPACCSDAIPPELRVSHSRPSALPLLTTIRSSTKSRTPSPPAPWRRRADPAPRPCDQPPQRHTAPEPAWG